MATAFCAHKHCWTSLRCSFLSDSKVQYPGSLDFNVVGEFTSALMCSNCSHIVFFCFKNISFWLFCWYSLSFYICCKHKKYFFLSPSILCCSGSKCRSSVQLVINAKEYLLWPECGESLQWYEWEGSLWSFCSTIWAVMSAGMLGGRTSCFDANIQLLNNLRDAYQRRQSKYNI